MSNAPKTRDRILKATQKLTRKSGGKTVSMSAIAKASNVSRQAVYLHFDNRAVLLVAAWADLDEALDLQARAERVAANKDGIDQIEALVQDWGSYLPEAGGLARAVADMAAEDKIAREAWNTRMDVLRTRCAMAVARLASDGQLAKYWNRDVAADLLANLLSFDSWDRLAGQAGWSEEDFIDRITASAILTFVGR